MSYDQLPELVEQLRNGVRRLQETLLSELDFGLQHYSEELDSCKTRIPVRLKEFGGIDIFAKIVERIVDEEIISTIVDCEERIWNNVKSILSNVIGGINQSAEEISDHAVNLINRIEASPEVSILKNKLTEKEEETMKLNQTIEEHKIEVEALKSRVEELASELRAKENALEEMREKLPEDISKLTSIVESQRNQIEVQEANIHELSERAMKMEKEIRITDERWARLTNVVTDDTRYGWFFKLTDQTGWTELKRLIVGHPTVYVLERWVKPFEDKGLVEIREENGKVMVKALEFE
ncbi:MAG: hypothetical protein ACFE7E_00370 [Candidatus Hodarchaeota archaeon]